MTDEEMMIGIGLIAMLSSGGRSADGAASAPAPSKPAPSRPSGPPSSSKILDVVVARGGFQHPMPTILVDGNAYAPTISDGFKTTRTNHVGVDVMYKRKKSWADSKPNKLLRGLLDKGSTWDAQKFPKGEPKANPLGTEWFFCPPSVPVHPIQGGQLWHCSLSSRGWQVLVDHRTYISYYQHLARVNVPLCSGGKLSNGKGAAPIVSVDSVLGIVGGDPTNKSPVHLHFELALYESGKKMEQDPAPVLAAAPRWTLGGGSVL